MSILIFLIFGVVVGWLASVLLKTEGKQGLVGDLILGVIGSFLGGLLMNVLGEPGVTGFNLYSFMVAIIGSIVFVLGGRALLRMM